tara:strand:+ start:360 stop:551 length:192 start_codon:yes stop_codon:yes gene_type:complete
MPREFDTNSRKDWNAPIHQILKAIDNHNMEYFRTSNSWHLEKANILRTYLNELKTWIKLQEKK